MIAIKRKGDYIVAYEPVELMKVANAEKCVPRDWITVNGSGTTEEFRRYALPLIQGENPVRYENGLPRFAKLKKIKFKL